MRFGKRILRFALTLPLAALGLLAAGNAHADTACPDGEWPVYTANVVVLDSPMVFNRLGAQNPNFVIYALERDVISLTGGALTAGGVALRPDKRPRPLVLRVPRCSKLTINFENLLSHPANPVRQLNVLDERISGSKSSNQHASGGQ